MYTRHLFTIPKYKISTRIWPTYILSTEMSLPWFKAGVGGVWGGVFVQRLPGYISTSYKFLPLYSRFAYVQFTYARGRFGNVLIYVNSLSEQNVRTSHYQCKVLTYSVEESRFVSLGTFQVRIVL